MYMSTVEVFEWSNTIQREARSVEVAMSEVVNLVKLALAEFSGVGELISNLEGTIRLACESSASENSFRRMQVSTDGRLMGALFAGTKGERTLRGPAGCTYAVFSVKLSYTLFSITVQTHEHTEKLKLEFERRFNDVMKSLHQRFDAFDKRERRSRGSCMPTRKNITDEVRFEEAFKRYDIDLSSVDASGHLH